MKYLAALLALGVIQAQAYPVWPDFLHGAHPKLVFKRVSAQISLPLTPNSRGNGVFDPFWNEARRHLEAALENTVWHASLYDVDAALYVDPDYLFGHVRVIWENIECAPDAAAERVTSRLPATLELLRATDGSRVALIPLEFKAMYLPYPGALQMVHLSQIDHRDVNANTAEVNAGLITEAIVNQSPYGCALLL